MNFPNAGPHDRPGVDLALLVTRVVAGIIFTAHGAQKLFGAFGGPGLAAMVQPPPNGMGMLGYPVSIGEFFGGLGLIVGFLSRAEFLVGRVEALRGPPFRYAQKTAGLAKPRPALQGFEYNLALIGLLAPTLLAGPGRLAIGRCLPFLKSAQTGRPIVVLE